MLIILNQRSVVLLLLACLLCIGAAIPAIAATLTITIRDERGVPVAARVYLSGKDNQAIFSKDAIIYDKTSMDGISERDFVPPHGTFSINLPPGTYSLVVERGKEYLPVHMSLDVKASTYLAHTIVLHRWIDMAARGWFSADMHVHRSLSDLPALMEAEDLSVAIPITRWKTMQEVHHDPSLSHYLSAADDEGIFHPGENRFFPVLNEEVEPRASALLASFLGKDGVGLTYPLSTFGLSTQAKGGVSDSEKATSLELPALAAVGACQTVGVANNHLWRSGSFAAAWGAWPDRMLRPYPHTCLGFVHAGFDMYATLLDMGFPLKLSAGSASGVHPVPPGWSRIYVHSKVPLTPRSWLDALKEGRSFVTTGPMLFLRVNGKEPGEVVRGTNFPVKLHATVEMFSLKPVTRAEIVLNGSAHTIVLTPVKESQYRYTGALDLTTNSSAWIAARWSAARALGCDAAHTSPIYFWDGDKPIPLKRAEAEILLDRVNGLIDQVSKHDASGSIVIDSEGLADDTLKYLKQARDVYQRKIDEASR